jgi:hypothetical protein
MTPSSIASGSSISTKEATSSSSICRNGFLWAIRRNKISRKGAKTQRSEDGSADISSVAQFACSASLRLCVSFHSHAFALAQIGISCYVAGRLKEAGAMRKCRLGMMGVVAVVGVLFTARSNRAEIQILSKQLLHGPVILETNYFPVIQRYCHGWAYIDAMCFANPACAFEWERLRSHTAFCFVRKKLIDSRNFICRPANIEIPTWDGRRPAFVFAPELWYFDPEHLATHEGLAAQWLFLCVNSAECKITPVRTTWLERMLEATASPLPETFSFHGRLYR